MSTPTTTDTETLLVDYHEASRLLCLSVSTLEKRVAAGTIPHVRIGRAVRFSRTTLSEWITQNEKGGATDDQ